MGGRKSPTQTHSKGFVNAGALGSEKQRPLKLLLCCNTPGTWASKTGCCSKRGGTPTKHLVCPSSSSAVSEAAAGTWSSLKWAFLLSQRMIYYMHPFVHERSRFLSAPRPPSSAEMLIVHIFPHISGPHKLFEAPLVF